MKSSRLVHTTILSMLLLISITACGGDNNTETVEVFEYAETTVDSTIQDTEPTFDSTIMDQVYIVHQEITVLQLPEATGGNEPLTYSVDPELPSGLMFDPVSRTISGILQEAILETTYVYTVMDSDGDEEELSFKITVYSVIDPEPPLPVDPPLS